MRMLQVPNRRREQSACYKAPYLRLADMEIHFSSKRTNYPVLKRIQITNPVDSLPSLNTFLYHVFGFWVFFFL